jgi:hypothetical protein
MASARTVARPLDMASPSPRQPVPRRPTRMNSAGARPSGTHAAAPRPRCPASWATHAVHIGRGTSTPHEQQKRALLRRPIQNHPERNPDWRKLAFEEQAAFLVGGYVPDPSGVERLLVGVVDTDTAGCGTSPGSRPAWSAVGLPDCSPRCAPRPAHLRGRSPAAARVPGWRRVSARVGTAGAGGAGRLPRLGRRPAAPPRYAGLARVQSQ